MGTSMDTKEFRRVMGQFTTGVTVVTIPEADTVHGMTANSFTSVSLEPPLILISIDKRARAHEMVEHVGRFGVTILNDSQQGVSNHFAGKPDEKVEAELVFEWFGDVPVLSEGLARIACQLWATYDGGDHTLFLGLVEKMERDGGEPLLYFQGNYRRIGE